MARWRTRLRGSRAERGAAAVEFAIVLTVLLLIIFAIIDFGRLLFASQAMKSASREGARTGVIQTTGTGAAVSTAVTNAAAAAASLAGGTLSTSATNSAPTPMTFNAPTPPTLAAATQVNLCPTTGGALTVSVSTSFRWFTPVGIFSSGINNVSASTTMRCE